ncbi:MAG TPA: phosphomethylpyrimidine synthase, partial [candidate division Zixibacteria bacterium]|nr:phosphomethylpyrimidine synthase [candidate division Zixibacteria bacterium]
MTQLQKARDGEITKEMRYVAQVEGIDVEQLQRAISDGIAVIPANKNHRNLKPIGIGKGLLVKVNANIGTSAIKSTIETELIKLETAIKAGADTVMDLSTGDNIDETRKRILEKCAVPLGTVPIYQT